MDAQKSPLAMLAATCNSIGAPDLPKNIKNVELPPSKKSSPVSTGGSENKRPRRSTDTPEKPDKKLENHRHHQEKSEDITKERERDRKEKPAEEKIEKPEKSSVIVERTERKASKSPSSKSSPTPPKSASAASMTPFNPAAIPTSNPFTGLSSSMSDPLNFSARLKTPLQLPGMMPYCRDPFCYGCSTSMHCGTNPNVPMDYSALSKCFPWSSQQATGAMALVVQRSVRTCIYHRRAANARARVAVSPIEGSANPFHQTFVAGTACTAIRIIHPKYIIRSAFSWQSFGLGATVANIFFLQSLGRYFTAKI